MNSRKLFNTSRTAYRPDVSWSVELEEARRRNMRNSWTEEMRILAGERSRKRYELNPEAHMAGIARANAEYADPVIREERKKKKQRNWDTQPEMREEAGIRSTERWANSDYRERVTEKFREYHQDPENRQRKADQMKEYWS